MPINTFTAHYERSFRTFVKHQLLRKESVKRALTLFATNPRHPSLHLEKLKNSEVWTIRVDKANRLFFIWSTAGDVAIFFFVGPHDSYRTKS